MPQNLNAHAVLVFLQSKCDFESDNVLAKRFIIRLCDDELITE